MGTLVSPSIYMTFRVLLEGSKIIEQDNKMKSHDSYRIRFMDLRLQTRIRVFPRTQARMVGPLRTTVVPTRSFRFQDFDTDHQGPTIHRGRGTLSTDMI